MKIPLPFGLYLDIWRTWHRVESGIIGWSVEASAPHASIRRRKDHRTLWTRRLG